MFHPISARSSAAFQNSSHMLPRTTTLESGYYSMTSRENTLKQQFDPTHSGQTRINSNIDTPPTRILPHAVHTSSPLRGDEIRSPGKQHYNMPREPESSPLSHEQLATEIKGIYGGLVMVEAKCINMDAALAANPHTELTREQWQARIALHRTLLYEHHDFLMATQHPSATQALRDLPTKYSMPARMWKHGIHAFLEVLRHRRPKAQEFMLAFIYIAYQMMALLFETVSNFVDTWIECLGDLSRYRMAIEEDKEAHATWGAVAARWYTLACDRHPATGRLYHHLGILERPSLRKFCFYAKSLSCVVPFWNAQDSLTTLCTPIVQDEQTVQSSRHSVEARIVTFHAAVYLKNQTIAVDQIAADALELLDQQNSKVKDIGAFLAVTNVAAKFEFGSQSNPYWQLYTTVLTHTARISRPSANAPGLPNASRGCPWLMGHNTMLETQSLSSAADFCTATFNQLFREYEEAIQLQDMLPYAHIMLVWLHSLHGLQARLRHSGLPYDPYVEYVTPTGFSSECLAGFLNSLLLHHAVSPRILELARQGFFPAPTTIGEGCPLSEDYLLRGLIWAQFYFPHGWFARENEDNRRMIETPDTRYARAERVLWLGLYLAVHTDLVGYNASNQCFFAATPDPSEAATTVFSSPSWSREPSEFHLDTGSEAPEWIHRSSISSDSSGVSDEGFQLVSLPKYDQITAASNAIAGARPTFDPRGNTGAAAKEQPPRIVAPSGEEDSMLWSVENTELSRGDQNH